MAKFQLQANGKVFEVDAPDAETAAAFLGDFTKENTSTPIKHRSWLDVGMEAPGNIPGSMVNFGKNIIEPFVHPINTAENIGGTGMGLMQKAGLLEGNNYEKYPDAIGKLIREKYGSMDALKNTIATDPVGFLADISTVLTGGGTALAKAGGITSKVGEAIGQAGKFTNPLTAVIKAGEKAKSGAEHLIGDLGTHTGARSLSLAAEAGHQGGTAQETFLNNISGEAPTGEVVGMARDAVKEMANQKMQEYQKGVGTIFHDPTVLNFDDIDKAIANADKVKTFMGVDLSPSTLRVRKQIKGWVEKWKKLNPDQYHTVAGFDALKRAIGEAYDAIPYDQKSQRKVALEIYHGVRKAITDQAPDYAKVMKDYEKAAEEIREMENTLSLKPKQGIDQPLRKLQSILRNNASTSYGRRKELGDTLTEAGAKDLPYALAGQALQPAFARSFGRAVPAALGGIALGGAGVHGFGTEGALLAGAALPFTSPWLMGHAANKAGMAYKHLPGRGAALSAFQEGQLMSPLDNNQNTLGQSSFDRAMADQGNGAKPYTGTNLGLIQPPMSK